MGAFSQSAIQNITDRVAAIIALNLAGFESELSGATNTSLFDQIDATGDADLEAALMSYALAVDRMSLPENYKTALPTLLQRSSLEDFCRHLITENVDGGGYASFRAYLADKSAVLNPLFAEAVRRVLGEDAFTASEDVTTVHAPTYSTRAPDVVYTGADGSLSEDTTDAGDAGTADVDLFASDDDCLYVGSRYKFSQLIVGLSTKASGTITPTFQYWNGSAWATLTVTDNTTGFTRNDVIKWTVPSDWSRTYKDAGGTAFSEKTPLYYVRISRTANVLATPPVATCARIVPATVLNPSGQHLGVDQPPLAIVRISGANACVVDPILTVEYSRFKEPGVSLRALTPFGVNLTFTISYTNESGSNVTQAQSEWTAPAALATTSVTLNGSDTGVRVARSTGSAITTNATDGVFEIYAPAARTPAL